MAIAYDTHTTEEIDYSGNLTFAHSCTGSDLALFVFVYSRQLSDISGCTYNGVSMTDEGESSNYNVAGVRLYSLIAPATGSNNVVVTVANKLAVAVAISYTGVDQTDCVEAIVEGTAGWGTSASESITTLTDGAMIIDGISLKSAYALATDYSETEREDYDHTDANMGQCWVAEKSKATAGSETVGASWSTGDNFNQVVAAVKPASGGSPPVVRKIQTIVT